VTLTNNGVSCEFKCKWEEKGAGTRSARILLPDNMRSVLRNFFQKPYRYISTRIPSQLAKVAEARTHLRLEVVKRRIGRHGRRLARLTRGVAEHPRDGGHGVG
jgi:hypothetical protein